MGANASGKRPSPRLPLFSIRLSSATKSRWKEAAEREGRTLAGYIKHAVDHFLALSQHVWYCEKCDRWQDRRTSCEADIRFDQRQIDAKESGKTEHENTDTESIARRLDALGCPFQCSEGSGWDVKIGCELHYRWCPKVLAAAVRGEIEWPA